MLIKKIINLSVLVTCLFPSFNILNKNNLPNPQGTEIIYLQGSFGGIEINRSTEERLFSFNSELNCYELYVHLDKGDYFYPFDKFKAKPFYWDINVIPRENSLFTQNGLSWYSKYESGDGCWFVNQSGIYHFTITYLIENTLQNFRYVWTDEYASSIEFICDNSKDQFLLLDNEENQQFLVYTEKDDSFIFQYGYGYGTSIYNTTHITILGMEDKTMIDIPYDSNFSSRFKITKFSEDLYYQSDFINFSDELMVSTNGTVGNRATRDICAVLYNIEKVFISEKDSSLLSSDNLNRKTAIKIMNFYNSLSESDKFIVDNSKLNYLLNNETMSMRISDLIPAIMIKTKKNYIVSCWTFLLPFGGIIIILLIFLLFINFKKKYS